VPPRIVLNTRVDDAASRLAIHGLGARLREAGVEAAVNDWEHYDRYDIAVFMGYDHDLERARAQHPSIRVALADPKLSTAEWLEAARSADFLMVSSVEQRDAFLRINRNVLVYYMFPVLEDQPRTHVDSEQLIVGYHGNRVHLEAMVASVRPALEELGRRRPVTLIAVYSHGALGKAKIGVPAGVRVEHVQWTDSFLDDLRRADIGIVPNELPIRDRAHVLQVGAYDEAEFQYQPFDHLVRFKVSSNPGRLFPFGVLGIPVVADFTPSYGQFVLDGVSGYLASSPHGWFEALDTLGGSAQLRTRLGAELGRRLREAYDLQVDEFLSWCTRPLKGPPIELAGAPAAEDDLALLPQYAAPRAPWTWQRLNVAVRRRLGR
jgi:glycosyltransferase involved in cell wall biosynthesis